MRRQALERLEAYQTEIAIILADAEARLLAGAHNVAEVARIRWTLTRTLTAYQLFKHREIFDPAIAGGDMLGAARAARMKAACLAVGDAYRHHVQTWSAVDVGAQWPAYERAAMTMVARIRSHLARERAEVATLLTLA